MTTNHCLNVLRRRRLVRMLPFTGGGADEELPAFDPPDPRPDPHAELAARRAWQRLALAVAALPPSQRAVLVLVRWEGLSYRDAAEALGISLGAVESRLVRAMRRLAAAQEEGPGGVP
jgi:RNA polymerase sigma-70 factor (ECF subfamily)